MRGRWARIIRRDEGGRDVTSFPTRTLPGAGALDLTVSEADGEPMIALVNRATDSRSQWRPADEQALEHLIEDLQTLRDWIRYGGGS